MDARATQINDEMLFAVAEVLSEDTPSGEIVPNPFDLGVHLNVARATARAAMESKVAKRSLDEEYFQGAVRYERRLYRDEHRY